MNSLLYLRTFSTVFPLQEAVWSSHLLMLYTVLGKQLGNSPDLFQIGESKLIVVEAGRAC